MTPFEVGARYAVKTAALKTAALKTAGRMGVTVPTGYRYDLNNEWVQGLSPELQARAQGEAAAINEWLAQNGAMGTGVFQHPEFSRRMALLGKLNRPPKLAGEIKPPKPPPQPKPPTVQQPSTSNVPVVRPAIKSNGTFDSKLTKLSFQGSDKLPGGKADKAPPSEFNAKELADGTKHETEHVSERSIAREIASDHLKEDPKYYSRLRKAGID